MKGVCILSALLVSIYCFVGCASEPKTRSWAEAAALEDLDFDDLDADGDEFIDEDEYLDQFPGSDLRMFENADDNEDEKLDEDEYDWIQ